MNSEWTFEFNVGPPRRGVCPYWAYIVERPIAETPVTIFDAVGATDEGKREAIDTMYPRSSNGMYAFKIHQHVLCKVKMNEVVADNILMVERHYRLWLLPQDGTIANTAKQIGYWNVILGHDTIEDDITSKMNISFENAIMEI